MEKFRKLVEAGPIGLQPWAEEKLGEYADTIVRYDHIPQDEDELVDMVGDADALLVRTQPAVPASVLSRCRNLKYVGMCCSLYSKESANVDIDYAEKHGITVYGIRDYGDKGVTEFVVYALVRILHGYDWPMWRARPKEITGLRIGFVGFGTSGRMTARLLKAMGAEISYYARSIKQECEDEGMHYMAIDDLLEHSQVVVTCLNKGVILLHEQQFRRLGRFQHVRRRHLRRRRRHLERSQGQTERPVSGCLGRHDGGGIRPDEPEGAGQHREDARQVGFRTWQTVVGHVLSFILGGILEAYHQLRDMFALVPG